MPKYSNEIKNKICSLIESDSYTIAEMCKIVNISERSYYDWQSNNAEFAEAIKKAKEKQMDMFLQEAKKSLLKKIQGYTVDETKIVTIPSKEKDSKGKSKKIVKEETVIKKHIAPDTAAVIFTLTNCDPSTWRNRQHSEITGKDGDPLFEKPRLLTSEEAKEYLTKVEDEC